MVFAAAWVLFAASGLQGEPKDPAPPPDRKAYASLGELSRAFDDAIQRGAKEWNEKRLAALEKYVAAKEPPPDRDEALATASSVAFSLEKWAVAGQHADRYLADFPEGKRRPAMAFQSATCLSRLEGKEAEAKAALEKVAQDYASDSQAVFNALNSLVELLTGAGNLEGARGTLDRIAEVIKSQPWAGQYLDVKRKELDLIGTEPKPIDVKDLDRKPLRLADLKGKVVLLDFWATWCGPCRVELPNVLSVYREFHDRGFEILGVSLDEDEKTLKDFLKEQGMTWPQFFDGKKEVSTLYEVRAIPATFLLNKEGKIHRVGLRGEAVGRAVEKLLGPAPPAKSPPAGGSRSG